MNKIIALSVLVLGIFIISGCSKSYDADVSKCENFKSNMRNDLCFTTLALKSGDVSFCSRIKGIIPDARSAGVGGCITGVALDKNDPSICNKVSDSSFGISGLNLKILEDLCQKQVNEQ